MAKLFASETGKEVVRMNLHFRIAHGLTVLSFPVLVLTGFALKFPDSWWAQPILQWENRFAFRGTVHRAAAVVLLASSFFLLTKYTGFKLSPRLTRIRDFAGKYNYGIYLAHALVLYFLDDPLGISYKLCTLIVSIPLTALVAFVLSLLLVWLVSKLPWVGKWISG